MNQEQLWLPKEYLQYYIYQIRSSQSTFQLENGKDSRAPTWEGLGPVSSDMTDLLTLHGRPHPLWDMVGGKIGEVRRGKGKKTGTGN